MTSRAATPEGKIEAACIKLANRTAGVWATTFHVSPLQKVGKPDAYLCHQGRFVGIEYKATPAIDATAIQHVRGHEIEAAGGSWHVVGSLDHMRAVLADPCVHGPLCRWCQPGHVCPGK